MGTHALREMRLMESVRLRSARKGRLCTKFRTEPPLVLASLYAFARYVAAVAIALATP